MSHYQEHMLLVFSLEGIIEILTNMCRHVYQKEKLIFIAFTNFYFIDRIGELDKSFSS